ncbi:PLP-dependent aminotransferase family protein [Pseudonocardia sp.]|uniref:MocR-like pyridoxine biosynthesis transcription factor PdxR n=1 Tax=Pseudonocardia sp. TaxID=60912 RepID=UPI003D0FD591
MELLELDPAHVPPRDRAGWLAATLRGAVADGRVAVGSRLPASRVLAAQLGVSRGVVVDAYQRLVDEGLCVGRRGGGTVVHAAPVTATPARPGPAPVDLDLSPGLPDLSAFPRAAWLRAERAVLDRLTPRELGYGDPRGSPVLREALAGRLARTRGIRADPADLIVTTGVAQGLALVAQVLVARGHARAGVEDPGSHGAIAQTRSWGLDPVPIPVDGSGLDVAVLAASGVGAVFVTPAHQFPTGVVLAGPRRRALAAWANDGGVVVEDDYDAEHRYDRAPVAALHSLAPDRIVHVGSVSKTLAPALRIGWLLAPPAMRDELVARKYCSDIAGPALPQLALAELITTGELDRHLRLVRVRHRTRRDALVDALARHLPAARLHGVAAGLHLLVTLPDDVVVAAAPLLTRERPEREDLSPERAVRAGLDGPPVDAVLAERARRAGVAVHPLSHHRLTPGPPGLVLGYAAATPDRLREAARRLGTVLTGP